VTAKSGRAMIKNNSCYERLYQQWRGVAGIRMMGKKDRSEKNGRIYFFSTMNQLPHIREHH